MQRWFGLNPLDVILDTVAFCTVALASSYIYRLVIWWLAKRRVEPEHKRNIDLTQ
jgi:hypothetical protein